MKNKIFLLLAIFLILSFEVVAQQCVQCEGGSATGTNASIIGTNNIALRKLILCREKILKL